MSRSSSLVVVSDLAGAGKSSALNSLEDLGYYCVDNLPPALMSKFADLCEKAGGTVERAVIRVVSFAFRSRLPKNTDLVFDVRFLSEGRAYLTLAFGCAGGRHRSVAISAPVAQDLEGMGCGVTLSHRELVREAEKQATAEETR